MKYVLKKLRNGPIIKVDKQIMRWRKSRKKKAVFHKEIVKEEEPELKPEEMKFFE